MGVQFKTSGTILFSAPGSIAMDPACCCEAFCCGWPTPPDTAITVTTVVVMSGITYIDDSTTEWIFDIPSGGKQQTSLGGDVTETENCLDTCFGRGSYTLSMTVYCIEEGHVQGSSFPWAKDNTGTPLDPGIYIWVIVYVSPGANWQKLVPVEVLSCDPVHVTASVDMNVEGDYYYDSSLGSGTWGKPGTWPSESECCPELQFDIEITE